MPSRQVKVRGNDLPSCKVSSLIDDDDQKQTLRISPKTTIHYWASWNTISIPEATLKYSRMRANVTRRKAEERSEAEETEKLWAKIGEQ